MRDIALKAGMKIIEKENEEIKLDKKDKLVAGTKEIPVLFEEADGLWINLQGKDRKEQIEKYKATCEKEGKEYRRQLERLIAEKRYEEVPVYLEYLKYEVRR